MNGWSAGKIEQVGAPADIYERPCSRYVAEFIGEINIFAGRASRAGEMLRIEAQDGEIEAPARDGLADGAPLACAVRPERIRFAPAGEEGANRLAGVVHDVAYRGDHRVFRVRLKSGALARVAAPSALPAPQPGEAATLVFDTAACVVLDA